MGDVGPGVLALVGLAVLLGSTVQSVVGIGMGLIAAPVITLLHPDLMPGAMIMLAFVMAILTLLVDRGDIDWYGLNWSLPARLLGTAVGVWVVTLFTADQLGAFIGVMVMVAVLLTWRAVTIPVHRGTLSAAGFVGGVTGTATSIGGPPFALLYQHRPAREIRSTMAVYFLVGAGIALIGLGLSGDLTGHQVAVGGLLLPAVGMGAVIGVPLRTRLTADRVRPAVLAVSGVSALVLVVRSLL